jgi:antibiotic biosynthesis monooxygenase (ABM) superfamily enzyme
MVTHIVFFTFKPEEKSTHLLEAKRRIEEMAGKIPSLKSLEVGLNFSQEARAMDMALVTQFDDRDGLDLYATHPIHREVIAYIKHVAEYTQVVDYEHEEMHLL